MGTGRHKLIDGLLGLRSSQSLGFDHQVFKKDSRRTHGQRWKSPVLDLPIGDDLELLKQGLHSTGVLRLIESALKVRLFFQLLG